MTASEPLTRPSLRLLALNLQGGVGTTRGYWQYATSSWKYLFPHGEARIRELAGWITRESIDVVTLSEVEGSSFRSGSRDQCERLRELTPLEHARFFPTHAVGRLILQGNAVLAKHPLRDTQAYPLPGKGEPRRLCAATLEIGGRRVAIFTTHLSLGRDDRRAQLAEIASIVGACPLPAVLTGDFNTNEPSEFVALGSGLRSAGAVATFPSWAPTRQLDHVFVTEGVEVGGLRSTADLRVSDHLGLVLEVTIEGAEASPVESRLRRRSGVF